MELSFLRPLYARPGPWASAYVDASRDTEDAAAVLALRWRGLAGRLAAAGAPGVLLAALGEAVLGHETRPGRYGLAAFGAPPSTVSVHYLPAPPPLEVAAYDPLPHAMPLVAQRGDDVSWVRVVADRTGADLDGVDAGGLYRRAEVRGGERFPLRKVHAGGWSQERFQRSAEESWKHNAGDVAAATVHLAERIGADVVIIAGDVRARELLAEKLPARWRARTVQSDAGSRAPGADEEALDESTVVAVAEVAEQQAVDARDRFGAQEGAGNGLPAVVAALQRAQVDTLLLVDDPSSTDEAQIGSEATQLALSRDEVVAMGVAEPRRVRADAALVRALVGTDAGIVFVGPDEVDLEHGVGAVLRWNDATTRAATGDGA
jgi:hypothetical protein